MRSAWWVELKNESDDWLIAPGGKDGAQQHLLVVLLSPPLKFVPWSEMISNGLPLREMNLAEGH